MGALNLKKMVHGSFVIVGETEPVHIIIRVISGCHMKRFSLSDTAWVFDFSANDGYDNNYQVDGGLNVAHQSSYRKLANVFTTQTQTKQGVSSEDLKAVSLSITSKTNVNYTIEIYTDLKDKTKPTSGTKQETATTTGQTTYAGYTQFHLNQRLI